MSEISQQVEQQIGRIIHKINSPLGAIRIWAMMIQEDYASLIEADEDLAMGMKFIFDNAEKAIKILEELSESIRQTTPLQAISVEPLLLSALSQVDKPENVIINHSLETTNHNVLATNVLVDLFINIIANGFDAMPNGGELSIDVEMSHNGKQVLVTFTDTGLGMPKYVANSLFNLYFTTKTQEKGHGIGLWWSRAYAQEIGGDLQLIKTEIGKGSIFQLSLKSTQ